MTAAGGVAAGLAWPSPPTVVAKAPVQAVAADREPAPISPAMLVDQLSAEIRKAREQLAKLPPTTRGVREFYVELLSKMEPTEDPGATFLDLASKFGTDEGELARLGETEDGRMKLAMLGARYSQWFHHDPDGFAAAWESRDPVMSGVNGYFVMTIAAEVVEKDGVMGSLDRLDKLRPEHAAWSAIASDIAKREDLAGLQALLESSHPLVKSTMLSYFFYTVGEQWPLERRDELVSIARGEAQARVIASLCRRMNSPEGLAWVKGLIDGGVIDEKARESVWNEHFIHTMGNAGAIPVVEQVALLRDLAGEGGNERTIGNGVVTRSLQSFFNNREEDWLYAFRHGQLTASEVREAARAVMGEMGEHRREFNGQIFRHLAEDDLDAAMELLGGMSPRDQDWQKIYAARWWFYGVDPDRFVQLVSSITLDEPAVHDAMWNAWRDKSRPNLERYGDDYLEWIKAMPPGPVRTSALRGLHGVTRQDYPWIHQEVTELLSDKP
jgi:hypothetical protein